MSRYIDADALKMDLDSIIKADYGYTADVLAGLMIAERVIDNAPTVDVAPVVHGRWIASHDEFCACSICKYPVYVGVESNKLLPELRREDGCRHAGAGGRIAGNDMNIKQMKFRRIAENTQLKEEEQ